MPFSPVSTPVPVKTWQNIDHPGDGSTITLATLATPAGALELMTLGILASDWGIVSAWTLELDPAPSWAAGLSLASTLTQWQYPVRWSASSVNVKLTLTSSAPITVDGFLSRAQAVAL